MLITVWKLQAKRLATKMDAFATHVEGHKPSRAHLRFFKDALYGLHGFAIEDPCSSLQETGPKNILSHAAQTLCLEPKKASGNPPKGSSKLSPGAFGDTPKSPPKPIT